MFLFFTANLEILDQWLHGFSSACIAEIRGDLNPPLKREIIEEVDISHNSSMDPLSFRGQRQNMAKGRLQETLNPNHPQHYTLNPKPLNPKTPKL